MGDREMQSRLLELCAIVFAMLRSPSQLAPGNSDRVRSTATGTPQLRISPMEFAFLMLGSSLALMLSGSATFIIGVMLMPWVIGMAMFLFFCGIVSYVSALGWSVLCPTPEFQRSPRKEISGNDDQERRSISEQLI